MAHAKVLGSKAYDLGSIKSFLVMGPASEGEGDTRHQEPDAYLESGHVLNRVWHPLRLLSSCFNWCVSYLFGFVCVCGCVCVCMSLSVCLAGCLSVCVSWNKASSDRTKNKLVLCTLTQHHRCTQLMYGSFVREATGQQLYDKAVRIHLDCPRLVRNSHKVYWSKGNTDNKREHKEQCRPSLYVDCCTCSLLLSAQVVLGDLRPNLPQRPKIGPAPSACLRGDSHCIHPHQHLCL